MQIICNDVKPTYDPDGLITIKEIAGIIASGTSGLADNPVLQGILSPLSMHPKYYPFPNYTQYLLSSYSYKSEARSGECSVADYNALVKIVLTPGFVPQDLQSHTAAQQDSLLDKYAEGILREGKPEHSGRWAVNMNMPIQVPEGKENWTNPHGQIYNIPGLHHRSIVDIIKNNFETNKYFHYTPFKMW
ncbi:hypothetical protein M422DRAFT_49271 [Sphaerobolus stellatus SS14]|uniref:Uncharacterized protein n=1 Tax=Sphaerobolus stellatus (strain SS14) TaxID=990650 RepID=A0A0C9VG16_SPHS4|nr:hypothetical protein M422DRAFT_49271 [Sphaerobolus stellatus SS14]